MRDGRLGLSGVPIPHANTRVYSGWTGSAARCIDSVFRVLPEQCENGQLTMHCSAVTQLASATGTVVVEPLHLAQGFATEQHAAGFHTTRVGVWLDKGQDLKVRWEELFALMRWGACQPTSLSHAHVPFFFWPFATYHNKMWLSCSSCSTLFVASGFSGKERMRMGHTELPKSSKSA